MSTTQNETAKPRPAQARRPAHTRTALPAGPDYWPVPSQRTPARRPQAREQHEASRRDAVEASATT